MLALRRATARAGCSRATLPQLFARELKIAANQMKPGSYLSGSNIPGRRAEDIFSLVDSEHVKPGKGGAYIQAKLTDIRSKDTFTFRFNSSDKVEMVELEPAFKATYLYSAEGVHHFMNMDTFDTVEVDSDFLAKETPWLQDGMEVKIRLYEEKALAVVLPASAVYAVAEAEPGKAGKETKTNKLAVLDNGMQIRVPLFVETGDRIVVRTEDGTYMSKEKE